MDIWIVLTNRLLLYRYWYLFVMFLYYFKTSNFLQLIGIITIAGTQRLSEKYIYWIMDNVKVSTYPY